MTYSRHPEMANRHDSALLVIDVQERLIPHIAGHEELIRNVGRLIAGAGILGVPVTATEQYPRGLGATVESLRNDLPECHEKITFSAATVESLTDAWQQAGRHKIVVVGMESHVCVLQSVLDLMAAGFNVFVVVDAVSSRSLDDKTIAIKRMEASGATLVSTEMILFEWLEEAGTAEFKAVQKLIK